jgi:hypothetical protein
VSTQLALSHPLPTAFFWPQAVSRLAASAARASDPTRARRDINSERIIGGSPSWPFPAWNHGEFP